MTIDRRLHVLAKVWPASPEPCGTCAARPAVVGVAEGEEPRDWPAVCPECGRVQRPVVEIVGVNDDAI